MSNNWEEIDEDVLEDRASRCADIENSLRRKIAEAFNEARDAGKLSVRDLARELETSVSQVQRLLHEELGGSLTLRTIVRAADALHLQVAVHVRPADADAKVAEFGRSAWTPTVQVSTQPCTLALRVQPPTSAGTTSEWETASGCGR